jgi:outer membrane lipoprotein-sorting protein
MKHHKTTNRCTLPLVHVATLFSFALLFTISAKGEEQTLASKLCSAYESIETVSCQIRKTTESEGSSVTMLSRVFYKKNDLVHVENVSPAKRRIIADGKKLYYHEENVSRGFSRPIADLEPQWLTHLRNVPGTPMEHLIKLKTLQETRVPGTAEFPERRSYQSTKVFVVLSCDTNGRPARIEFYKTADMDKKTGEFNYSAYFKVSDNCWIPCLHKAVLFGPGGEQVTETRRIDNLEVNKPIADKMFSADLFFKDVDFVPEFKDTYSN